MAEPLFDRTLAFTYGAVAELGPKLRRVIARNGGPFTFHGTGTYIVGRGEVAIIDPGPLLEEHEAALLAAVAGETVSHLLITHTHRDHSPLAARLKETCNVKTYGLGPHGGAREQEQVEEGADYDFKPDVVLKEGDTLSSPGWALEAIHTPGHTSNHLCFAWREAGALFSGDHVMGWSTTIISPPDGDMRAYQASLTRLLARSEHIYWPTHGGPVRDPKAHVRGLLDHRAKREAAIIAQLAAGGEHIMEMVPLIYAEVAPTLYRAAGRSVLAHLIALIADGRVACEGAPGMASRFRLVG
jgi:glyoxylase-like metal-dependent hydrolase (beta-lactamase superfamily II)